MAKSIKPENQREDVVTGIVNCDSGSLSVSYDHMDESILLHGAEQGSVRLERGYQKQSGRNKVLLSVSSDDPKISFNSLKALRANFDHLIAIDTSTTHEDGVRISATIAYCVPNPLSSYRAEIPFIHLCGYVMVNVKEGVNPETLGWYLILSNHVSKGSQKNLRIGVVVDSEFGKISKINSRESPYYAGNFLPSNATLIYAADAAADTLPNQMLRMCDKTSKVARAHFAKRVIELRSLKSADPNCDGYAYFRAKSA